MRDEEADMFEKVMVCLDGSSLAEQIIPYATEQAGRFGSQVVLFQAITTPDTVIVPPVPGTTGLRVPAPESRLSRIQREEQDARLYLERLAGPLRDKGLKVECVTAQGAAGPTIVSYAEANAIGLIALATHGRSGLGRVVFGSTAEFVLRHSSTPVLLVRSRHRGD